MECTHVCQVPKKPGARITQYLWFLESLFTPLPYPKPLQLRVWVLLPFPSASLSYVNQPLQFWAFLASGWIALVLFALLAFSLTFTYHCLVQSGPFQVPLSVFSLMSTIKPFSTVPRSRQVTIFIQCDLIVIS